MGFFLLLNFPFFFYFWGLSNFIHIDTMSINKSDLQSIIIDTILVCKSKDTDKFQILVMCMSENQASLLLDELKRMSFSLSYFVDLNEHYNFQLNLFRFDVVLHVNTYQTDKYEGFKYLSSGLITEITTGFYKENQIMSYCDDGVFISEINQSFCLN